VNCQKLKSKKTKAKAAPAFAYRSVVIEFLNPYCSAIIMPPIKNLSPRKKNFVNGKEHAILIEDFPCQNLQSLILFEKSTATYGEKHPNGIASIGIRYCYQSY